MDDELVEQPVDSGMDGNTVAKAEWLWNNLPIYHQTWERLTTAEKASVCHAITRLTEEAARQAREIEGLRGTVLRAETAFSAIASSHWERFGIDQTDVEQVPDLSADEAMNLARDFLSYDDFQARALTRSQSHD